MLEVSSVAVYRTGSYQAISRVNDVKASTLYHAVFRLVNGSTAHEGRIEVYHAGRWGTVCDDYFGTEEGNMVCQMLGYE